MATCTGLAVSQIDDLNWIVGLILCQARRGQAGGQEECQFSTEANTLWRLMALHSSLHIHQIPL